MKTRKMMLLKPRFKLTQLLAVGVAMLSASSAALAQNGTWTNVHGGSWADSANWLGGVIANGSGSVADFGTLNLSADATVTLDGARTIGQLIFADRSGSHNWFLNTGSGGPLTLGVTSGAPIITVSNQTATINAELVGVDGLTQDSGGTLVLAQLPAQSGGTTNEAGILELLSGLTTWNNSTWEMPLVVNGVVDSAATLNLDVKDNTSFGSTNILGKGTLRLVSANSSGANEDLFFGPDVVGNEYYGAALAINTLDLGSSQRYIFALTAHNAVGRYDPYEDARIDANIIGSGGITYIAQNTYTGSSPMECPLVLAGSNTFTGEVEIQRGSIYLFTPQALARTNRLLMDPAENNNARLFLYGNGATVANLESSGPGNSLIANGNVANPIAISPATLTVNETSNTTFDGVIVDGQYEYDPATGFPSGSLSLAKEGPGSLTLTGANSYTGSTMINAGELVITSAQSGDGGFSVAGGAALGITNINGNSVRMSDLALGANGNTTLDFTFGGAPAAFAVAPITTTILEADGGANSVTINIGVTGGGIPMGEFPLIQYSGSLEGNGAGFRAFHLGALPAGVVASLADNTVSGSIDLKVTKGVGTIIPSGPIVEQSWTSNNSPYIVTGDVNVAGLKISPGVTVQCASNYSFEVDGVLRALGAPGSPIVFCGTNGGWQGIYFNNSAPGSILNCCIVSNSINSGLRIVNSNPTIDGCSIVGNSSGTSVYGGGIYASISSGPLAIVDSTIANNSANINPAANPYNASYGGGVYAVMGTNASLQMIGCILNSNQANANYGFGWAYGGGLYVSGKANLDWCVINGNSCTARTEFNVTGGAAWGGGVYVNQGQVELSHCLVQYNTSSSPNTETGDEYAYGGGIYIFAGSLEMTNSIVQGNIVSAPNGSGGGGVCVSGGVYDHTGPHANGLASLDAVNCTFAYNNLEGVAVDGDGSAADILNSILYFNNGGGAQIAGVSGSTGPANVSYSDVQGAGGVSNNINANPVFLSTSDLIIVPGSPCVNAGSPDALYRNTFFPPSLGHRNNDMGAHGGPEAGATFKIIAWPQIEAALFGAVPGYSYQIQASTNLADWQTLLPFQVAHLGMTTNYIEPVTNSIAHRFYRLTLAP